MFRNMRRNKQLLSEEQSIEILNRNTSGVLSVIGDNGYPYGVPLSYVYNNGKIYFHCAKSGHKIDAIKNNSKVSFCVIDKDDIVPEKFTTYFRSVIAFGNAEIIEDAVQKREAIEKLADKYSPNETDETKKFFIDKEWDILCMIELKIEHLTGKEAIELKKSY